MYAKTENTVNIHSKWSGTNNCVYAQLISIVLSIIIIVWCTIELIKIDGRRKEYLVNSRFLETETGEKLCEKDLVFGKKLIWKSKGVPYEVTMMERHSGKLLVNEKAT